MIQFLGGNQNIGRQRFIFNGKPVAKDEILQSLQGILSDVLGEEEAESIIKAATEKTDKTKSTRFLATSCDRQTRNVDKCNKLAILHLLLHLLFNGKK